MLNLVSIGGLVAGKRPELAIEVLSLLRAEGVEAYLTWVGEGPLRGEIEGLARERGVTNYLRLTGSLEHDKALAELAEADIFFLPTAHETFCVAAAEAVSAGLPVVLTDLPAVHDFLDESNSVLVQDSAPGSYVAGIRLAMSKFCEVSAEQISQTISDKLSPEVVAELFDDIYRELRKVSGSPPPNRDDDDLIQYEPPSGR
ncbi:glycosyltransferase involved in cell wall biosynthesis [Psychromicrobium silvestre]|uniref:D-inositol 3-phosphate glycosyltransferase n=1 Tax=Psychromicrobium silvestre TaxID=1645614 RepID=A0A7Y9LSQ6_9MICC|nr:glycosyltransferase involved in cell wall biosynthesis [Psychromicrobium silvestre]